MANKILGYILSIIGVIVLALSFPPVRATIKLTLPSILSNTVLMIAGLILTVLGLFLIPRNAKKKGAEVPIYQGKDVVGFRRI